MNARRLLPLLLSALLLAVLLRQINHYLAAWQLSLWCGGLFVAFTSLRLQHREGAAAAIFAGLLLDSAAPVALGTQTLLFLAVHAVIHRIRPRLPREETIVQVLIALVANLVLWLALSVAKIDHTPAAGSLWLRVGADLLISQVVIALIAPWFFAVQTQLLVWSGTLPPPRVR